MRRVSGFGAGVSMALVFVVIFVSPLHRDTLGRSMPCAAAPSPPPA